MNSAHRTGPQARSTARARTSSPPVSPQRTVLERLNAAVSSTGATQAQPADSSPGEQPDPFNGRSFRLDVVNAAEDIPRLVRGFVKVRGVECALVLRPLENQGLLIHAQDGQAWKWVGLQSDIPTRPEEVLAPREALALLKGAQTQVPAQGPVTLRGMWSGKISCDRGQPCVSLQRKVSSYGVLKLWSDAHKSLWLWRVERAQKWFSRAGQSEGSAESLMVAIQQGLASAMGLLGEACSVRDSRRRAALDAQYAEVHPLKPAREGKDPTEKFNPKEPRAAKVSPAIAGESSANSKTGKTSGKKALPEKAPTGKAPGAAPTGEASSPEKPKTDRRKSVSDDTSKVKPKAASPANTDDIDAAKDKLLMDAFGSAIATALGNMSGG